MQSIDHLIDAVANYASERSTEHGIFYFSKIDLKYAYSQIPLDPQLQKHCNLNILGGKATGTYRFLNGFYGLTDMPATFQKTIDVTLRNCHKFAFLDDILVIPKGSIAVHEKELHKIIYQLDKENLAIKLQKSEFAKKNITWLGYQITPTGITPTKKKCESINKLEIPKTLKQLRSFIGCIHHLIKFTPRLAELSEPLRPLLSKNNTKAQNKLDWKEEHTIAFENIKKQIINISENKHFDINKETRIKSDASKIGLGACLEQEHGHIWKPVAYASRFLNRLEREQANLISIIPAPQHTTQDELTKAHTIEKTDNQKTDDTNDVTTKNNTSDSQEPTGITRRNDHKRCEHKEH